MAFGVAGALDDEDDIEAELAVVESEAIAEAQARKKCNSRW